MKILDVSERDELLKELSTKQKAFIDFYVKRGKKTTFANVLALDKGMVLPESATIEEREMLLDEWVLDDYIDNGFVNPETPCECGKALRYQYIVRHLSTNQVRRFGIIHFEEHTGLPASIISSIKKGFTLIDYECDELLLKMKEGWSLLDHVSSIPNDLKLAKDIQQHLDADVPLLERQITRLQREIFAYQNKREENSSKDIITTIPEPAYVPLGIVEEQASFELFETSIKESVNPNQLSPTSNFQDAINRYLQEGVESARLISELLIKHHGAGNRRYITGKPRVYLEVCQYLEGLVYEGKLILVNENGKDDRVYRR
ncbi:MAG: DUF3895 domain-containing protein [Bacillus sp. (in: Bacteria)]|nr:DUF3895 domain-containing protein [Bacillus sp. (in: firmicutes)]